MGRAQQRPHASSTTGFDVLLGHHRGARPDAGPPLSAVDRVLVDIASSPQALAITDLRGPTGSRVPERFHSWVSSGTYMDVPVATQLHIGLNRGALPGHEFMLVFQSLNRLGTGEFAFPQFKTLRESSSLQELFTEADEFLGSWRRAHRKGRAPNSSLAEAFKYDEFLDRLEATVPDDLAVSLRQARQQEH